MTVVQQIRASIERDLAEERLVRAEEILRALSDREVVPHVTDPLSGLTRPAAADELLAAATELEQEFACNASLLPVTSFAELVQETKEAWQVLARRYFSNACDEPQQHAEALYLEFDGELPQGPGSLAAEFESAERECRFPHVEYYKVGELPAHRAMRLAARPEVYPLPTSVTLRSLTPVTLQTDQGRYWHLGLLWEDGRLVPPIALNRTAWARGAHPQTFEKPWTLQDRLCFLVEIYRDLGDYGYPSYELAGYAVMTAEQLGRYLASMTDRPSYPRPTSYEELVERFGPKGHEAV